MKIKISKTELYSLPYFAWNEYCYHMMDMDGSENEAQYTPVQKTASLCFFYHSEVSEEGHEGLVGRFASCSPKRPGYFEYGENADEEELTQALRTIGAPEFADNFVEAARYGQGDEYVKTDTWFEENEEKLLDAIQKYLRDNVSEFFEIADEDYTMRQSSHFYRLGAIGAVFFFALMVIFIIVGTDEARMAAVGFAAFCLTTAFYALYAKIWKVTVKNDTFTVYKPFRKPEEYRFGEISEVRHTLQGLVVYVYDRKTFAADNSVSDFDIFHAQLREACKPETMKRNSFTVRLYYGNMLIGLIAILFLAAVYIWIVLWPDETMEVIKYLLTTAVALIPLCLKSRSVLWRLTVSDDTIIVKKLLTRKKEYRIRDITEVYVGYNIIAHVGDKEIFRLSADCIDAPLLIERLKSEGVPFNKR